MTSAGGAAAMAALGPRGRSGSEERRRLLRAVSRLQAGARGFLLRRRLRAVRDEFEAAVLEIEGDLGQLRWSGRLLLRPQFGTEDCPLSVPGAQPGFVPPGEAPGARPAQPKPGEPLDPGEAAENEAIPKKPLEKPNPPGAARAGSCGNTPSSTPNPLKTPKPPNLGAGAEKNLEKEGRTLERSQEWDRDSKDLRASTEIPRELQGLPSSELRCHRNHLLMELLWVQQAIASREHFLMLKQKLGIPHHPGSFPELLDWCGEALELQQEHS